jgi:DNA-binding NtrC family response regulator
MVEDLNGKHGRRVEGVTEAGMRGLMEYDWPGNIRELKNVMERVFIDRDAGRITESDLVGILPGNDAQPQSAPNDELHVLRTVLVSCQWNKSKAAEKLNWSRMRLYRKLAKYDLTDEAKKKAAKPTTAKILPNSEYAIA